ncbi:hypothetical protein ABZ905_09005 [Streptomyces parvus]|uniref:hypothetical protein n=1 Tax=Streptomyces parvus TaxID=66428 RepID=UPI0033FDA7A8
MDATTRNAIFEAAAKSTYWKRLNIGLRTEVSQDGYTYTVDVPSGDNPAQALITYRAGYGGTEFLREIATWGQTMLIVDTAMGALRVH